MKINTGVARDAVGYFIAKPSASIEDIGFDWRRWALPAEDTITSSVWAADLGIDITAPDLVDGISSALVGGGTAGTTYLVSNTVTTASGRKSVQSLRVKVT